MKSKTEKTVRPKLAWGLLLISVVFAHYYFFYVRPYTALSDREKTTIAEAVTVCVDAPLLDWIPLRFTPIANERGEIAAIDAAIFYGTVAYRINLRARGGQLTGCSIDYFPDT
mgnify:CR=1 FL=1